MKILALELSTSRGSLAWLDGEIEFTREWPNDRKNSAAFFENLQAIRRKFGAPETITVGLGPVSYAGTRIAISEGEDYELLFATSPRDRNSLERQWQRQFPRLLLTRIGSLNSKSQIANRKLPSGYVHFQQPR